MPVIGVYWQFVRMGYRRESRYLAAALAGLVANATFGLIKAAVLLGAAQAAGGTVAGYDAGTLSAYVWLSQGMLGAMTLSGTAEIGERIRTGDIAVDLTRPVDVQLAHLATDLGRATFTFVPRGSAQRGDRPAVRRDDHADHGAAVRRRRRQPLSRHRAVVPVPVRGEPGRLLDIETRGRA